MVSECVDVFAECVGIPVSPAEKGAPVCRRETMVCTETKVRSYAPAVREQRSPRH